jgi:hypothetical protein
VPDIEPGEGDGPGGGGCRCRDGRGCHDGPEPLGWADQVTGTTCASEPFPWKEMAALPAPEPRLTWTTTVMLCPAGSVPP